ncbi:DUF3443 family protein [Duganella sp. FT50W]|uniref:DUF3443 family protein n=1 Tax=Duganella lactea TaxID=2692173 RepID=A0A6L8MPV8_9BURK|nr:DUF3443 family protein [Duganella lactea]MYM84326.1 DUF3443 family protein [Duganella lactea]
MKYAHLATALLCLTLAACGGGGSGASSSSANAGTSAATTAPASVVSISATPTATTSGQVVTLSWNVSNATTSACSASGAWRGSVATSGTRSVTAGAAGTAAYTLTCGDVSNTATVAVATPPPSPSVSLTLAPASISSAQSSVLSWSSANATSCTASGAWSGSKATAGAVTIVPNATGSFTYSLTCNGDGGTATGSAALSVTAPLSNSTAITVDSGPSGVSGVINVPYVSVTVCRPGTTVCQTIDHVLLDTGSYGLRLLASQMSPTLALPAVSTASGDDAGTCGKFISGYTWGAVRQADVRMADELGSAISIQVIGDSGASYTSTPSACSSAGANLGTLAALGAKGILGVGLFRQDCGAACVNSANNGVYYECASGACAASTMPLARQISNPVASFATNNNGLMITLPSVDAAGLTAVSGTLVFGVNTQDNNRIGGETIFQTDGGGDFMTTYKGKTYSASFIDSGTNSYTFTDSTIRQCSGGDFYCPATTLSLSATNTAADGSASGNVNFNIVNLVGLPSTITAAQIGSTVSGGSASSSGSFAWGLPFFFGRRVFVVMENQTVAGKTGPYWAY